MVLICAAGALLPFATACGGAAGEAATGREVVAGLYPLAFAAAAVAREDVDVTNLAPPGAEPHDLELSARDVGRIRSADVVVLLGRSFQPALADAAEEAEGTVVDVLPSATSDPHVWLDPVAYARIARRIAAALGRRSAAEPFVRRLRALDRELRAALHRCRRREIVTSHAAFGHLAARYGLRQIPVGGQSPALEPSARDLERVVDAVRAAGATTIFTEPLVSPRVAETVAQETGASTAVLDPLEGLDDDALARGEDYFSVMRANAAALRDALGCR